MRQIISDIIEMLRGTTDLIQFEEDLKLYMFETMSEALGDVLTEINQTMKKNRCDEGWENVHTDSKTVNFSFGPVTYRHTTMRDGRGTFRHPLNEWLGIGKYQRHSALVEVKVAEMATEMDYRETARVLKEWTAVDMSHTTVANIVKRVGKKQADTDQHMVEALDAADCLPEGKKVDVLFVEADGVFVRSTKRRKGIEVSQAIVYEGWSQNGKRVALKAPMVVMSTEAIDDFWNEVQTMTAMTYSLEQTQVEANSDGGVGYGEERFKTTFSQSGKEVLCQIDKYHVSQAIIRTFGAKKSDMKTNIKKAIEAHDQDQFILWMDTYESTEDDPKKLKRLSDFKTYILNHWHRYFDWRDKVADVPDGARTLGAMESNQRRVSYRMKKRGMHWSQAGALGMVKLLQARANKTLRSMYLNHSALSQYKQKDMKKSVRMSYHLSQKTRPSVGAKQGGIPINGAHSSAIGQLVKSLSLS